MSEGDIWQSMRAATAQAHADLEALPINRRLFAEDFSALELANLLGRFVTVYRPFEALPGLEKHMAYRKRLPLLLDGLAALEECILPPADQGLPALASPAALLGALYVVEGASMGGQMIHRHLSGRFPARALAFFVPHGTETGENWRRFRAAMETDLADSQAQDMAMTAAISMFHAFHQALAE